MQAEFMIPNTTFEGSSVLMTLTKTRNLFIGGMNQVKNFMLIYATIMILILFIIFTLLGRYISQPFIKLVNDVKSLDLTENEIPKIRNSRER